MSAVVASTEIALSAIEKPAGMTPARTNRFERVVHHKMRPPPRIPNIDDVEMCLVPGEQMAPVLLEGTLEVEWADAAFASAVAASERLTSLLATLEGVGARHCVFGGWLRDTVSVHAHGTPGPRDIDLVASDISADALIAALPTDVRPTMFGGIQSSVGPVQFDIWPLHETFLIRSLSLPASFHSLVHTADFNINAALYFPAQAGRASAILDAGMISAIHGRRLAFNSSYLPFPVLQCARILAYHSKLDLHFDHAVLALLREILTLPHKKAQVIDGLRRYQSAAIAEKAIAAIKQVVEDGH